MERKVQQQKETGYTDKTGRDPKRQKTEKNRDRWRLRQVTDRYEEKRNYEEQKMETDRGR